MGVTQCNEKVPTEHLEIQNVTQEQPNELKEYEIKYAKNLSRFFDILHKRKRIKEVNKKFTNEIYHIFTNRKFKFENSIENSILDKFDEIFNDIKKILTKFKLEKDAELIIKRHKDLLNPKEELKEYLISQLQKYHIEFVDKIIQIINKNEEIEDKEINREKDKTNNNVFSNLIGKTGIGNMFNHEQSDEKEKKISNNKTFTLNHLHIEISNSTTEKMLNEFDLLFNYINPKRSSIFIDYFLPDEFFPKELKNIVEVFFYFIMLTKCQRIENTKKYIRINKKQIKKRLSKFNVNHLIIEEIIEEDYQDLFDILDHEKMEITNNPIETVGSIDGSNQNFFNDIIDKKKNGSNIRGKEKFNDDFIKKDSSHINDKNNNKKTMISIKSENTFINSEINYEYFNGEFDKTNFLYCGTGTLIKNREKNYYYHGTFKMGKKHGIGMIYKIESNNKYEYYRGEWKNNKREGYGFQIIIDDRNKLKMIKKGKFLNNFFHLGSLIKFVEKNSEILVEKYEGEIIEDLYTGHGTVSRKLYKTKSDYNKVDLESEYDYDGPFVKNLESGMGFSKKNFNHLNYNYTYEGEFKNGKMNGMGKIKYDGDYYVDTYEGIFLDDKQFSVYGKVKFKSGDEYEGFFNENQQKTKVGLYFHNDKNQKNENFFGQFLNDKKDGLGRFVSPKECKVLVGNYIDGEKNGNFSLSSNNIVDDVEVIRETKNIFSSAVSKNNLVNSNIKKSFNLGSMMNSLLVSTKILELDTNKEIQIKVPVMRTDNIKQMKLYFMFENDEIIEKSDRPII